MEDLKLRLERATDNMSRIFRERDCNPDAIFQYLGEEARQEFARKMMEYYLEKKRLELQRERCDDILGRYRSLVDLGVELDVRSKIEIRQYVSRLSRQHQIQGNSIRSTPRSAPRSAPRTWLNGCPVN